MERLTARDLRRLLDFVADLHAIHDVEAFARHVVAELPRLVPVNVAAWSEVNYRRPRMQYVMTPAEADFPGAREAFARHLHEHPMIRHFRRTGDGSAMKMSDFLTQRQFHDLGLYQEFFRRFDVEYLMNVTVASPAPRIFGVALCRQRCDFSERERRLFDLLRAHLIQAYGNAEAASFAREERGLTLGGLEGAGVGLISLDGRGRVRELSTLARRLLEAFLGPVRGRRLPAALADWLTAQGGATDAEVPSPPRPLVMERDGTRLVARLLRGTRTSLVLVQEERGLSPEALEPLGLSRREAEVLQWVTHGKTNREIATILGLSPRTVQHHVERILRKTGVETRTAAAAVALQGGGASLR